jgi:membrane-bound ClpP family serine protease
MGANSQQGWALFVFVIGFTFLVAGLAYIGMIFALIGLICLIASAIWFIRIKPLEYAEDEKGSGSAPPLPKSKRAV